MRPPENFPLDAKVLMHQKIAAEADVRAPTQGGSGKYGAGRARRGIESTHAETNIDLLCLGPDNRQEKSKRCNDEDSSQLNPPGIYLDWLP